MKSKEKKLYLIHGFIKVHVLQQITNNVDISYVIKKIENTVPKNFFYNIDGIYIVHIPEFDEREINALHKDGVIYISPDQDDNDDLIDDIIHEVAHAVDKYYEIEIYSDMSIEKEFLGKRMRLFDLLEADGQEPDIFLFKSPHYNRELDDYFYKSVGYDRLASHSMGLFVTPYSPTSLGEYFAEAFEEYFIGDRNYLKTISPSVYRKIKLITTME